MQNARGGYIIHCMMCCIQNSPLPLRWLEPEWRDPDIIRVYVGGECVDEHGVLVMLQLLSFYRKVAGLYSGLKRKMIGYI